MQKLYICINSYLIGGKMAKSRKNLGKNVGNNSPTNVGEMEIIAKMGKIEDLLQQIIQVQQKQQNQINQLKQKQQQKQKSGQKSVKPKIKRYGIKVNEKDNLEKYLDYLIIWKLGKDKIAIKLSKSTTKNKVKLFPGFKEVNGKLKKIAPTVHLNKDNALKLISLMCILLDIKLNEIEECIETLNLKKLIKEIDSQ